MAIAPAPPAPQTAPGVTLSHRSNPNPKVVFLDGAANWQLQHDGTSHYRSKTQDSHRNALDAASQPFSNSLSTSSFSDATPATPYSSPSSSRSLVTPASLSMDLAAAAVTSATTLPHTPHSSSVKSGLSSILDHRRDASMPNAATPTPAFSRQSSAAPSLPPKHPLLAWSQPKSWAGYASKDSGATCFTNYQDSGSSNPPKPPPSLRGAPSSDNGDLQLSSPLSLQRIPHAHPASSQISSPSKHTSSPWTKNQRSSLEAMLADAHTRFSAPLTVPRGLINTGNFCFANAILQVLIFCAPFYNLFTTVGKELSAELANTTPLMEAVVHFLRAFRRTTPGESPDLSGQSKSAPNPALSEPLMPGFVYEAMRLNKRFDLMRRGHQEDAEEFLGFFLDTLHEELLVAIGKSNAHQASTNNVFKNTTEAERKLNGLAEAEVSRALSADAAYQGEPEREVQRPISPSEEGWMEVGQKGKTAFTRTTSTSDSPITKIFGGKLRSVLRTPGAKDSVTLEPYQPLQLDIQPNNVLTIEDALLNLTVPETIPGVFSPARGGPVDATKQVFIEHLPPVLILHLKRFLYDEVGGVQKNSKEVGYGDVLEVGGEMVSHAKRSEGNVVYRLFGVVYHHGRYATGGHYTVDVLRQDSSSWIHFDDTLFNPVSTEHVGRKPNHSISSSVGHDGLAYLLFYRREDAVRKHNDDQQRRQQGRATIVPACRTVFGDRHGFSSRRALVCVGAPVNRHARTASSSSDGANKANGSASAPGKSGASGKGSKAPAGTKQSQPSTQPQALAPAPSTEVFRQIPGAPPGKMRRIVSSTAPEQ